MKQKLLEMVRVTIPFFFYFDEIRKMKKLDLKNIHCLTLFVI